MAQWRLARALRGAKHGATSAITKGDAVRSAPAEPPGPLSTDLTEEVEVRFVIVDALVVDRNGRIVPDLAPEDFERRLAIPDHGELSVDVLLQIYAWHGKHHVAHITSLRERVGW